jgi:hypothetical protein
MPEWIKGGEYITGSLAAGINLSQYLWDHTEMASNYTAFLAQCGGSNNLGLAAVREIRLLPGTDRIHRFCHIIHPDSGCARFALSALIQVTASHLESGRV